jgi:hypothetical protein
MELFAAGRAENALGAMALSPRADKERVNSSAVPCYHPTNKPLIVSPTWFVLSTRVLTLLFRTEQDLRSSSIRDPMSLKTASEFVWHLGAYFAKLA